MALADANRRPQRAATAQLAGRLCLNTPVPELLYTVLPCGGQEPKLLGIVMKFIVYCLLLLGAGNIAWADAQIRFKDAEGNVNTMQTNGSMVRINGGPTPGYLLLNGATGEFFIVNPERNEIIKVAPDELAGMTEVGDLNMGLKTRGGREKVAGYTTGRYDLLVNGSLCGTLYGSSELIQNSDLQQMLVAMRGMHKLGRAMVAGLGKPLSECQRAESRLADLADSSGFVLRFVDDQGQQRFEVISLETDAVVDEAAYELPQGMPIVDMSEKMQQLGKQGRQMQEQMTDMNALMQQIEENGGQMTEEMQQRMQEMMQQMQQMQQPQ
jgi:hypothetical protein